MRDDFLSAGVVGLAKAVAVGKHWFHGHFGAAVLAGHALLNDFDLPGDVCELIEKKLDELVGGNKTTFDGTADCHGFAVEPVTILRAIESATPRLAASGHGTIYATLGLRAMAIDPTLCTQAHCDGIAELVRFAGRDSPDRYFGTQNYFDVKPTEDEVPRFESLDEALCYAIAECSEVFADENIDGKRYFFAGEKIHLVTHAQALCELARLGHAKLAHANIPALRQQLLLARQTPPDPRPIKGTSLVPTEAAFWNRETTDVFHLIKLSYSALVADQFSQSRSSVLGSLDAVWCLQD